MRTEHGLRIYGAGIVSSKTETLFSLESDSPNRIGFNLERLMRTHYIIDDFQQTYFGPIYQRVKDAPELSPRDIAANDEVIHAGTFTYFES